MSKQGFDDFQKKIDASADMKKQVDEAYQKLAETLSQAHATYYENVAELGQKNGFEFTANDVSEKFSAAIEELDDAQLESVAGGLTFTPSTTISKTTTSDSTIADRTITYTMPSKLPGTIAAT